MYIISSNAHFKLIEKLEISSINHSGLIIKDLDTHKAKFLSVPNLGQKL